MNESYLMKPIAHIRTDFPAKFGVPRQAGLVGALTGTIVFKKEYRVDAALRGLEQYSHAWLVWVFSEAAREGWSPTVRPPRLGGNTKMGVFATRSPFRPNPIALSAVKLAGTEETKAFGTVLHVAGADLMDGTPILDIKPYLPYVDAIPGAAGGFTEQAKEYALRVEFPPDLLRLVPQEKREALLGVLESDPRPSYQEDPERVYGFGFAGLEVKFTVAQGVLTVRRVEKAE